ncbi:MAG: YjjG family noncanonical pyrimidine nucleotidase [Acidimicrobiales bacterium]
MRYSHLVFDFDHMLFDTDASEAKAFAHSLREHGVDAPETLLSAYQRINLALWKQVETGAITPNELKSQRFRTLAQEEGLDFDPTAVAEDYATGLIHFGELYEGASELIEHLAISHQLSMVTNGLGPVQRGRLERVGLAHAFEPLVISDEVGVAKPTPAIFDLVFDAHPQPTKDSFLMIGDSLTSDVQGGINVGIDTCWFDRNGSGPGTAQPTHTIQKLQELHLVVT